MRRKGIDKVILPRSGRLRQAMDVVDGESTKEKVMKMKERKDEDR